eukprot:g7023.t1
MKLRRESFAAAGVRAPAKGRQWGGGKRRKAVQPVFVADRRFAEAGAEVEEFLAAAKGSVIGFDVERVRCVNENARHAVGCVFCSGTEGLCSLVGVIWCEMLELWRPFPAKCAMYYGAKYEGPSEWVQCVPGDSQRAVSEIVHGRRKELRGDYRNDSACSIAVLLRTRPSRRQVVRAAPLVCDCKGARHSERWALRSFPEFMWRELGSTLVLGTKTLCGGS